MPLNASLIHLGLAKEAQLGTAVAPTVWMPVNNNVKAEDITKWIDDKALRGAPVSPIAVYAGPKSSALDADMPFYPDAPPNLIMALLGVDTVTGTAAPYTHTFTLAANQPPSYTLSFYNGYDERQYPGSVLEQLDFKWTSEGDLVASSKWIGYPSLVAATSTPTISNAAPFLGWQASLEIAGTTNVRLIGMDWSGKRKVEPIWAANNTQTPSDTFAGPLDVTGKFTFAIADDTELQYLLNNTQPATVLKFTAPNSGPTLTIQMSQCAFTKQAQSFSKDYVVVDYDFQAIPQATDAAAGSPISPVKIILTNSQSTAY